MGKQLLDKVMRARLHPTAEFGRVAISAGKKNFHAPGSFVAR
jgi:hypothetical protein